jgi:exodeoxyribonuclease V alpha subunit
MMSGAPRTSILTEILAGLVDRVTFHNSDNGFGMLRAKARGPRDLITVVGRAAMISAASSSRRAGPVTQWPHAWRPTQSLFPQGQVADGSS